MIVDVNALFQELGSLPQVEAIALNEMTHPGEKRMQSICAAECKILPENFQENFDRLFRDMFREDISPVIGDMVDALQKVCEELNQ